MAKPIDIQPLIKALVEAAHPRMIIIFGSHSRGESTKDSDVDFLVVQRKVKNKFKEMVRLSRVLRPLGVPVDILVVSQKELDDWGHLVGTPLYWALKEGKVVHEEAA